MSPKELRAFRENIGLSRREFAPKLFISEPTLERWERGQGEIGKVQLRILHKMREHLGAGHALAYFEYDAEADPPDDVLREERQVIIDILKSQMIVLLTEQEPDDNGSWTLCFGLGETLSRSVNLVLFCEGSDSPTRPSIDFTLHIAAGFAVIEGARAKLDEVCFNHGVAWNVIGRDKKRITIGLRQRIYNTNCNPETIKHVMGSLRSCWGRLKEFLIPQQPRTAVGRKVELTRASVR
jgi:transcriptional regulator with XRE-family HTH domain